MIADRQIGNAFPQFNDHTRGLVAVNRGQVPTPGPFGIKDVRVADRAGFQIDTHFPCAWRIKRDLLDAQRLSEFVANGGFHGFYCPCFTPGRMQSIS